MKKCICELYLCSEALSLEGRGLGEGEGAMFRTPSPQSPPLKGGEVRGCHINPHKTSKLLTLFLLCAHILTLYSPVHGMTDAPDCAIDQGPCSSTVAGRQVVFDISPRPVKTMKELTFTISIIGKNIAPTLLLDLSMPSMYMGKNEVILKKTPDGSYSGKGIIPRCPSGNKLWRAEVTIPGAGKVSYTFNVNQ